MTLGTILSPEAVRSRAGASSCKRLFQDIASIAQDCYGFDSELVLGQLLEREALGPTAVGHGVALPHACIDGLDGVHGMFLRLEKPIDLDAVDHQLVDLVFALLAPKDAGVEHLKALALVSRTLRDSGIRSKLRMNSDPAVLYSILTETAASRAA